MSRRPPTAATLIRRHLLAATIVTVGLLAALVGLEWALATAEADRVTRAAATRVAERVSSTLSVADLTGGTLDAATLDAQVQGFFDAGAVARIKVWSVDGNTVRVVYSDERRLIGDERPYSAGLADRLGREGVVVLDVPSNVEHRFEGRDSRELREAFIAFTDATGTPLRLEVYVPVFRDAWVASTLAVYVPVLVAGIAALTALLVPMSIRLARRLAEADSDRRAAIDYGLRSRERERLRLARRLHDDVLQNLAGSALALEVLASAPDPSRLRAISATLSDDARALRDLLDDDAPVAALPLREALDDVVAAARAAGWHVRVDVAPEIDGDAAPDAETSRLLTEATRELVRNARAHAHAEHIEVRVGRPDDEYELTVTDDGRGFPAGRTPSSGHGLRLLRSAFVETGGDLHVSSGGAGTTIRAHVPVRDAPVPGR
ncbi:sensor histidine kinase [Microbacterium sp. SORGH_AS_0888]|uniref:sensor histidine kinase n=1 Tax=Microbacterium sp. SORGH_AS_0888 TaxID=3041791 RepID=UPI00277FAB89|nr:ATP-binding protein [Microbacterium sp. SORGH_AS_0888]MDQ1131024.1 two-component system NarL family sensor kinase [Microbacterium sp. SORGH_AS_0888]